MGIGMMLVVNRDDAEKSLDILRAGGQDVEIIGEIVEGSKQVIL